MQAVDPVLVGKVRAKQYYSDDHDRTGNLGVLLHGDGSFSGQGVVYETLDMSALPDYTVGGVIHIVVNNQVRGHVLATKWSLAMGILRVLCTSCPAPALHPFCLLSGMHNLPSRFLPPLVGNHKIGVHAGITLFDEPVTILQVHLSGPP